MSRKPAGSGNSRAPKGDELLWLETYFIVFPHERRPTLAQVEHALSDADNRLQLKNLEADEDGLFASVLVESPEDHAAVEISYETGEAVIEQNLEWAKQLQKQLSSKQLQQLMAGDSRLEVAHFERLQAGSLRSEQDTSGRDARRGGSYAGEDEGDLGGEEYGDDDFDAEAALEIFDPTCLLTVVEALSKLTGGLALDAAAGEVV
jgi:hypothetical protein